MFHLHDLGWNDAFQAPFDSLNDPGLLPARVASEARGAYTLFAPTGVIPAHVSGKLRHAASDRADFPAVGDWVAYSPIDGGASGRIHAILPRRSSFSRLGAGSPATEQIVAANLDVVFLVMALNQDFNLRRLERYLVLGWDSGASPVVLLTKADLCSDLAVRVAAVEAVAGHAPVLVTSSLTGSGLEPVRSMIGPGQSAGLLGSSGAGKSTLINRLLGGDLLETGGIREGDGRGRHTTTHRELHLLPGGGLILDTPGMRSLGLWDAEGGLSSAFEDVETLARECRFSDCTHEREPGCAVIAALEAGTLDPGRLASHRKLARELAHQAIRQDLHLQMEQKQRFKQRSRDIKRHYQERR